jgi:hypothetical protein
MAVKECPVCHEAVGGETKVCPICQHVFGSGVVERPAPGGSRTLRQRLGRGASADQFSDHELLYLVATYTRSLYVLAVAVLLVNVIAAVVLFVAIQAIETTTGF